MTDTLVADPYQLMPLYSESQRAELKASIREHGVKIPIEFDKETGLILDGHHRFELFAELIDEGVDIPMFPRIDREFATEREKLDHIITVNVQRRHLTTEQRGQLAFNLRKDHGYTLSRIAQLLGVSTSTIFWDLKELGEDEQKELETIKVKGVDQREYTGTYTQRDTFTTGAKQIQQAHSTIQGAQAAEISETPAEAKQKIWNVQLGDVWSIPSKSAPGLEHRLMCGDSKSRKDALMLIGLYPRPVMLWTDPPYGVNYIGKTKDALEIDNDNEGDLEDLLISSFRNAFVLCGPNSPVYVCHPPGVLSLKFGNILVDLGLRFHETLVWVKDSMVLGHSDYHLKHEPIIYGWVPGEGRPGRGSHEGTRWYGNDSQVSVFEIPRPKRSEEHPTMKPTDLIARHIQNSSAWKDAVLDLFVGSGSTAAAAEQVGRVCYGMDIEPNNIAVALDRLAAMGLTPVKV